MFEAFISVALHHSFHFQYPCFPSVSGLLRACAVSIVIHIGEMADGMGESSSTADRPDPPSHAVVQYIERYNISLGGRWPVKMRLAGGAKEISDGRTRRRCDYAVGACIKTCGI